MRLDQKNVIFVGLKMQFISYLAKLVINNTQVQRNLGHGLIIIGVLIVTIVKTGELNKSHFTLILQMVLIVVRVTGK